MATVQQLPIINLLHNFSLFRSLRVSLRNSVGELFRAYGEKRKEKKKEKRIHLINGENCADADRENIAGGDGIDCP